MKRTTKHRANDVHLRLDADIKDALREWAIAEERTLTAHINYLLRRALEGRKPDH